ncbi:MAG: hypothetical protein OXE85_02680 [Roseovarius sp.]|nr:hypothetical protein [Roseovarius sp.]
MSNSDNFIKEVTEEVRKDRNYRLFRRYGPVAAALIILMVGGAAWNEWRMAKNGQMAEALGDAIFAALNHASTNERVNALDGINVPEGAGHAIIELLAAGEEADEFPEEAVARLLALASNPKIPESYQRLALLKAVGMSDGGLDVESRRMHMESLLPAGGGIRLLAEEQLALIDMETGSYQKALERFEQIIMDAEATQAMRQRALQMISALGGTAKEAG